MQSSGDQAYCPFNNWLEVTRQNRFPWRTALITGGASGFGLELARQLHDAGVHAVVLDIDTGAVEALKAAAKIEAHLCDVSDPKALREACAQLSAAHGSIDLAVANAATDLTGEAHHYTAEDWSRILDVNLKGATNLISAVYPTMVDRQAGRLVLVSSGAGRIGFPLGLPYTASKAALEGLAQGLRAEASHYGVGVSVATLPSLGGGLATRDLNLPGIDRAAWLGALPGKAVDMGVAARAVLRGAAANQGRIVVPWHQGVAYWLMDAVPPLGTLVRRQLVAKFHKIGRNRSGGRWDL